MMITAKDALAADLADLTPARLKAASFKELDQLASKIRQFLIDNATCFLEEYHADGFPELYRLSNLDEHGKPNGRHPDRGTLHWHTDGSWQRVTGQATIIYGEMVPRNGGETHFADMYGA